MNFECTKIEIERMFEQGFYKYSDLLIIVKHLVEHAEELEERVEELENRKEDKQ